ncbi:MAG: PH domain-containing protein [Rickettsiales bacterium]|nr:PH domain-containing protein [Pseudomonadota bacterium]MDA0966490.1 PH domain-containing protein [Pseudomonadota bacterium]MDG4543352.1 PH domain-containing protein [Rickettsiales bacterium]MDG4545618.1 PH domain-containing protein [Rickettsiales bacterium]MDG4548067.1 PH domain-containing protein [Rickettsiales bacterium]
MSYVENNLLQSEKIVFKAEVSPYIYLNCFVLLVVIPFILIRNTGRLDALTEVRGFTAFIFAIWSAIFGLVSWIYAVVSRFSTEIAVTNKRIIVKYGLMSRCTIELNLSKIESVSVNQGIMGRFLSYGTVTINGTGGIKVDFIHSPRSIVRSVNEQLELA